jgi:hypothetical protein
MSCTKSNKYLPLDEERWPRRPRTITAEELRHEAVVAEFISAVNAADVVEFRHSMEVAGILPVLTAN